MKHRFLAVIVMLASFMLGAGCGDDGPTRPPLNGGGVRLVIPDSLQGLETLRIELWNDNVALPPHCSDDGGVYPAPEVGPADPLDAGFPGYGSLFPGYGSLDDPPIDTCTRGKLEFWDFSARPVLTVPDTAWTGIAIVWDGRDDAQELVPSGLYYSRQECLDSRGSWRFVGNYYVLRNRERARCEWPLWITEMVPGPNARKLEFGPMALFSSTVILDAELNPLTQVVFHNPFILRVHAPGRQVFEREIELVDGEYTEVELVLEPAVPAGGRGLESGGSRPGGSSRR